MNSSCLGAVSVKSVACATSHIRVHFGDNSLVPIGTLLLSTIDRYIVPTECYYYSPIGRNKVTSTKKPMFPISLDLIKTPGNAWLWAEGCLIDGGFSGGQLVHTICQYHYTVTLQEPGLIHNVIHIRPHTPHDLKANFRFRDLTIAQNKKPHRSTQ